jgi:D-hydroxyproline dehydrogenase subunit alpha
VTTSPAERTAAEVTPFDLAVVGAGPAGLAAAVAAAERGVVVALVDGGERPGGQYWRSPATAPAEDLYHAWSGFQDLLRRLDDLTARGRVTRFQRHTVWAVERTGTSWALRCLVGTEPRERAEPAVVAARTLLLATGAYDRQLPFPGWDLPGVMTAGGVQALLKASGVVAGRRVVVAGTGPFLLPAAAGLARHGAVVPLVAEAGSPSGFLRPRSLRPSARKLPEATGYARTFLRHRIHFRTRHAIVRALGEHQLEAVVIARLNRSGHPLPATEQTVPCDVAAVGWGFTPQLELHLQAGCATHLATDGSLVVTVDDHQRTDVDGVWAAGESTGIGGADLATVEGELAGRDIAATLRAGRSGPADGTTPSARRVEAVGVRRLRRRRDGLRAFAVVMHRVCSVPSFLLADLDEGTVLCRCEEVTAGQVLRALDVLGATDARTVKLLVRAGMGWCQGRVCGFATVCLVAQRTGRAPAAEDLRAFAQRPIALPLPLGTLAAQPDL